MLRWIKPSERLPEHNEAVLVRKGNDIELAHFNKESSEFLLGNGTKYRIIDEITWMEMVRPNDVNN